MANRAEMKHSDAVEETKSGGKYAYGTHNYPDHLTHIDKVTWDVIVVGAGPAGLMLTVSEIVHGSSQRHN